MKDLQSRNWIVAKGLLFLGVGFASAVFVFLQRPTWQVALLLAVAIWGFCRFYYFVFYVLEHWIDSNYRYRGFISALRYLLQRNQGL